MPSAAFTAPPTLTPRPTRVAAQVVTPATFTPEPPAASPTMEPSPEPPSPTLAPETSTPEEEATATEDATAIAAAPPGETGQGTGGESPAGGAPAAEVSPDLLFGLPREGVIGVVIAALVIAYSVLYAAGAVDAGRYAGGFVIETCPVCQKGQLSVVDRRRRVLGIPRVRRTVHCDYCGSVLRQVGRRRWRYTVDGVENPDLYTRYNGSEIKDSDLVALGVSKRYQMVVEPPENYQPPEYVDEDHKP